MRIGILTFFNAYNLGGALQAFSLQKAVEELDADCEFIAYHCSAIEKMHSLKPVWKSGIGKKTRIYNLIYNLVFFPKRIRYIKFQRLTKKSRDYDRDSIYEANDHYDIFITGSDQVFNLKLTGDDAVFYLDFVDRGIKASYAASLGAYMADKEWFYRSALSSFDYLSVREKTSADLLDNIEIRARVMPDPVFLHSGSEWKKLLKVKEKMSHRRYLLIYSLFEMEDLYQIANTIAKEKGLQVYVITKALRPMGRADKYYRNAGPQEFIDLIVNADYVVTNSFHGTAFSLVFEKQFTTFLPPVAKERIVDLLKIVGCEKRIFMENSTAGKSDIDYKNVSIKLLEMKKQGRSFLGDMIS